jgi:hypothetical protein
VRRKRLPPPSHDFALHSVALNAASGEEQESMLLDLMNGVEDLPAYGLPLFLLTSFLLTCDARLSSVCCSAHPSSYERLSSVLCKAAPSTPSFIEWLA